MLKKTKEVVVRQILDDYVLVPVGRSAREVAGLFTTNEVGAMVYRLIDGERTREDIYALVWEEYEVDPDTLREDIDGLLRDMLALSLIEEV